MAHHTFAHFYQLREIGRIPAAEYRGGKEGLDYVLVRLRYQYGMTAMVEARAPLRLVPGASGFAYRLLSLGMPRQLILLLYDRTPDTRGYVDTTQRYTPTEIASPEFAPVVGAMWLTPHGVLSTGTVFFSVDQALLDEQPIYRGKGLGQAMYRAVLSATAATHGAPFPIALISGSLQTPASRRAWVRLSADPTLRVDGSLLIATDTFDRDTQVTARATVADRVFGELGLTAVPGTYTHIVGDALNSVIPSRPLQLFTFPVTPNRSTREMRAQIIDRYTTLYQSMDPEGRFPDRPREIYDVNLIARSRAVARTTGGLS